MLKAVKFISLVMLLSVAAFSAEKQSQDCPKLLREAVKYLPADQSIGCDNIVILSDVKQFLQQYLIEHPLVGGSKEERQAWVEFTAESMGFTLDSKYPIYLNGPRLAEVSQAYDRGQIWVGAALSPLLAHERVHAEGEPKESLAYQKEYDLARKLLEQRKIPSGGYDLAGLQRVKLEAETNEVRKGSQKASLDK